MVAVSEAEIVVDPEFQAVIPAPSAEEREQLERNLVTDGCRDPLVVWPHQGRLVLLDGHNRLEICRRLGIPYTVREMAFQSRHEARAWMADNQLGRRNLSVFTRSELALVKKEALAALARERQVAAGEQFGKGHPKLLPNLGEANGYTEDAVATLAGVSGETVRKVEKVLEAAPVRVIQAARAGDLSVHRAFSLTKALSAAGPRTRALAERAALDDAELIGWLSEGEASGREWFEEIEASGFIQPGDEETAVGLQDGLAKLQAAVDERARLHRSIGAQAAGKPFVAHNTGDMEWFTPPEIIAPARTTLTSFDLDPASSAKANEVVRAARYYDAEADGLSKPWHGLIWLNPPYAQPLILHFVTKLLDEWQAGHIEAACLLVNNATETGWFQAALDAATRVCFLRGRVKFLDAEGNPTGMPLQGQCVLYYGQLPGRFAHAFEGLGIVVRGPKAHV